MVGVQVVTFVLNSALRIALGHYLDDVDFGKLTFAISVGLIFSTLGELGLTPIVVKEVARSRERAGSYLGSSLFLRILIGFPLYGALCLATRLWKNESDFRTIVALVGLSILLNLFVLVASAVFQAQEKMMYVAIGQTVESLLKTIGSIALLGMGFGLLSVGWVMVAAAAARLLTTSWFVTRLESFRFTVAPRSAWPLLGASIPFFLWAICDTIYSGIGVPLLSVLSGNAVTGWYGAASGFVETFMYLPIIFQMALLPILSRQFVSNWPEFRLTFEKAFYGFCLVTPPIALGTFALAHQMIGLIYPLDQFANAAPVLRVQSLGFIPLFFNILFATVLFATDKQRYLTLAAAACTLISPILNLIFIPYFQRTAGNGGIGVAWTSNLIELLLFFVSLAAMPRQLLGSREWSISGRALLAGIVMATIVSSQTTLGLAAMLVIGAITYLGGCLVFGVARIEELKDLFRLLRGVRQTEVDEYFGGTQSDVR